MCRIRWGISSSSIMVEIRTFGKWQTFQVSETWKV